MQLGFEAQVEASDGTIRRAIGTLQYHECHACQLGWQSPSSRKNRVKFAEQSLHDLQILKIGIVFDSAMRHTLGGGHNIIYVLLTGLDNNIL